ncbi:hypothetical protein ACFX1Q_022828 [Malus domestica]
MRPQQMIGIYVEYDSSSIISYLKPLTCNMFTTRFTDCHLYETIFLSLGEDKNVNIPDERHELLWMTPTLSHLDPRTAQFDIEVHRILDLQSIAKACQMLSLI